MTEIAKTVFNQEIKVTVKRQEVVFDTVVVTYLLEFDNSPFSQHAKALALRQESSLPVKANGEIKQIKLKIQGRFLVIFEIFPFAILFDDNLCIKLVGGSLRKIMPNVIGD